MRKGLFDLDAAAQKALPTIKAELDRSAFIIESAFFLYAGALTARPGTGALQQIF